MAFHRPKSGPALSLKFAYTQCPNSFVLAEPRQLMDICRRTIRMQLGRHRLDRVDELRLPPALQRYLLYKQ